MSTITPPLSGLVCLQTTSHSTAQCPNRKEDKNNEIILWDSARYFTNISIFHTSFLRLSGSQDSPLQPSVCLKFQGSKVEYDHSESESVGSLLEIIHFSRMLVSPIDCWFMGGFEQIQATSCWINVDLTFEATFTFTQESWMWTTGEEEYFWFLQPQFYFIFFHWDTTGKKSKRLFSAKK